MFVGSESSPWVTRVFKLRIDSSWHWLRQAPPARTWTRAPLWQLASLRFRSNNALDSLCFASGTWLSTCPDMGKSGACAACITSSSTDSCKTVIDESVGWDRNLEMNQGSDVVGKCGFSPDGAAISLDTYRDDGDVAWYWQFGHTWAT